MRPDSGFLEAFLIRAVEDHNHGPMRDDATIVMIERRGPPAGVCLRAH